MLIVDDGQSNLMMSFINYAYKPVCLWVSCHNILLKNIASQATNHNTFIERAKVIYIIKEHFH